MRQQCSEEKLAKNWSSWLQTLEVLKKILQHMSWLNAETWHTNDKALKCFSAYLAMPNIQWTSAALIQAYVVPAGRTEITSRQLESPTDFLTWQITTARGNINKSRSWAQKANTIRCYFRSDANQAKVIQVETLNLWKELSEMLRLLWLAWRHEQIAARCPAGFQGLNAQ